ncbi:hypothetical protein AQ610_09400 [Burkholderia humptydooensis]|nr:hypothetical protein AQ610_09400 [Burkholderia humptydooensis]
MPQKETTLTRALARIKLGLQDFLCLGNRGQARDFVDAAARELDMPISWRGKGARRAAMTSAERLSRRWAHAISDRLKCLRCWAMQERFAKGWAGRRAQVLSISSRRWLERICAVPSATRSSENTAIYRVFECHE